MVKKNQLNIKKYYYYDEIGLHATVYWRYFKLLILLKVYNSLFILTVESVMAFYSKVEFGRLYSSYRLDD